MNIFILSMGIVSNPLFASPADARVVVAHLSAELINRLDRYMGDPGAIFKRESFTLGEFMTAIAESIKLYGYLTRDVLNIWKSFLTIVGTDNPGAVLELHFICYDERMAYYFQHHDGKTYLCTFSNPITREEFCIQIKHPVREHSSEEEELLSREDLTDEEKAAIAAFREGLTDEEKAEITAEIAARREEENRPSTNPHVPNILIELSNEEAIERDLEFDTETNTEIIRKKLSIDPGKIIGFDDDDDARVFFVERVYRDKYAGIYCTKERFDNMNTYDENTLSSLMRFYQR